MATGVINISTTPSPAQTSGGSGPITTAVVLTKDPVPNMPGVYFSVLGYPALNTQGHTAFVATVTGTGVTEANKTGIWADEGTMPKMSVAREGMLAPGGNGAIFSGFSDPVYNNNDLVAFAATLSGSGIARTNSIAVCSDYPGGFLSMVAQEGQQAPGCPQGAVFSSFTELALPDQGGVVFLGTLGNLPGIISSVNNQGIWAVDTSGLLQLVVQKGTLHPVTGKLITALSFLPLLPYAAGQTRSMNQSTGDIVYKATFKDGSSGFFAVTFP
jgi:hypothetical protein